MQNCKTNTIIKLRPTFEDEFMLSKNFIQTGESQFAFTDVDNLSFNTSHIYDEQATNKIVFELSICDHLTKSIAHHTQPLLFFFGQPLSGKTYTIEGMINKDSTTQEPGVLHHIFQFLQNQRADVSLAVMLYSKDQLFDAQNIQQQQMLSTQQPKFTSIYTQETINDIILMSRKKVKQLKFEACSKLYHFKYIANGSVYNYYVVDSCLYLDQQLNLTLQQALHHLLNQSQKQIKNQIPGLRNNKLLHYLSPCLNQQVGDIMFCLNISGCEKFCDFRKIQDIFIKIFSGQKISQDVTQTFTRSQLNIAGSLAASQSGFQKAFQPTEQTNRQQNIYKSQLLSDIYDQNVQQNSIFKQNSKAQQSMSPNYVSNITNVAFTDINQTVPQIQQNNLLDVEEDEIYQQHFNQEHAFQPQSRLQGKNSINMSQSTIPQIDRQNLIPNMNEQNTFNEIEQFNHLLTNHPQMLSVNQRNTQIPSQFASQQNNLFQSKQEIPRASQQVSQQKYTTPQKMQPQIQNQETFNSSKQIPVQQPVYQQAQISPQQNNLQNNQPNISNIDSQYLNSQNQGNFNSIRQSQMPNATQLFSNVSDLQSYLDQQKNLTINTAKQFVQQKLQEKNVMIETLRIQVSDLQQQLNEWKLQCQTVKNLQETEKELHLQQSQQYSGLKTQISQLLAQLNMSKVQSSDYKQELDRQIFINNQQVDQLNQYKARIQSLETDLNTAQAHSTAKDDQLLLKEHEITELNNQILEWKGKCNKISLELNELRPYKDVAYEMEVEITDYKNTISQKEVEIEQLKNEVVSLRCIVQQQSGAQKVEDLNQKMNFMTELK